VSVRAGSPADLSRIDRELAEKAAAGDQRRHEHGEERHRGRKQRPQFQAVEDQHQDENGDEEDGLQLEREGDAEAEGRHPGPAGDQEVQAGQDHRAVDRVTLRPGAAVHHHRRQEEHDPGENRRQPGRLRPHHPNDPVREEGQDQVEQHRDGLDCDERVDW
jgi:hypothetical protein